MSKYDPLWKYLQQNDADSVKLTYCGMERVLGFPIDHAFLKFKKELTAYGYQVGKISMKEQTVMFEKVKNEER